MFCGVGYAKFQMYGNVGMNTFSFTDSKMLLLRCLSVKCFASKASSDKLSNESMNFYTEANAEAQMTQLDRAAASSSITDHVRSVKQFAERATSGIVFWHS